MFLRTDIPPVTSCMYYLFFFNFSLPLDPLTTVFEDKTDSRALAASAGLLFKLFVLN